MVVEKRVLRIPRKDHSVISPCLFESVIMARTNCCYVLWVQGSERRILVGVVISHSTASYMVAMLAGNQPWFHSKHDLGIITGRFRQRMRAE